jgi:signal transduction histidine kinase/PAS domain-containing protein
MPTSVPESTRPAAPADFPDGLGDALETLLESTGATAGWVAYAGRGGRLSFPASRGTVAPAWLDVQGRQAGAWGLVVAGRSAVLNDLPRLPGVGEPRLRNLLSCPLLRGNAPRGHVVLANKPDGFTPQDQTLLLGYAPLLARWLPDPDAPPAFPPALAGTLLDRIDQGVLVLDGDVLVHANATWLGWTGFAADELLGRPAPFPFWPALEDLAAARTPGAAFPFRRKDGSLFVCHLETLPCAAAGRSYLVALLREPAPAAKPAPGAAGRLLEAMPFAVALTDRDGRIVLANRAFFQTVAAEEALRRPLGDALAVSSAAAVERLLRRPGPPPLSRLMLQRAGRPGDDPDLVAYAVPVEQPDGPGFLFAFSDDWAALCPPDDLLRAWERSQHRPSPDWLPLLLCPGREVQLWGAGWQALTGLKAEDLAEVPTEVVLDWLFPGQRDRDRVADVLHQPRRPGAQLLLGVLGGQETQPMLCTFLPLPDGGQDAWLLLAGPPEPFDAADGPALPLVRRFASGVAHVLGHHLAVPAGLCELARRRADLPAEISTWFAALAAACRPLDALVIALKDLSEAPPGDVEEVSPAALVQEFLDEPARKGDCTPALSVRDADATVRVSRRLFRTVLAHVLANAGEALGEGRRHIAVRVFARGAEVCCEVEDSGEGLPAEDATRVTAPFYSTKGPFADDLRRAALPATGLGLTACHHLLGLHGGRLELRSVPGEGTTATIVLPRARPVTASPEPPHADAPVEVRGPRGVRGDTRRRGQGAP